MSVTKKWRALPFERKKKKLAPDVLLITLCFVLDPRKKLAEKMVYSHWMPVGNVSSEVLHQIYNIFFFYIVFTIIQLFFITRI